jgi:hypothetical protein
MKKVNIKVIFKEAKHKTGDRNVTLDILNYSSPSIVAPGQEQCGGSA